MKSWRHNLSEFVNGWRAFLWSLINGQRATPVRMLNIHLSNKMMWLNSINFYLGISYCGIGLRFVDERFRLFNYILGSFPYEAPSHSAPHLREFVNTKLEEYRLKLDSTKYVVSDNEARMLAAFRDQCTRIGCSDHYLNKQLQHAFESEEIHVTRNQVEKVNCEVVQAVFRHVRKVVSKMRRSHKQQQLTRHVQSYSDTRFNGALLMHDSFFTSVLWITVGVEQWCDCGRLHFNRQNDSRRCLRFSGSIQRGNWCTQWRSTAQSSSRDTTTTMLDQ